MKLEIEAIYDMAKELGLDIDKETVRVTCDIINQVQVQFGDSLKNRLKAKIAEERTECTELIYTGMKTAVRYKVQRIRAFKEVIAEIDKLTKN